MSKKKYKYEDYWLGSSLKSDDFFADLKESKKDIFSYRVERIFTVKQENSFSALLRDYMPFLYFAGIVIMIIMLVPKQNDFIFTVALIIFFSCFAIAMIGFLVAFRMNARAKLYGFILAEKWDKSKRYPIGKELFFVKSTSMAAEEVQGIICTSKWNEEEKIEQQKLKARMINYFLETMKTEEFKVRVEQEINHPKNSMEGWYITPMSEIKLGRTGVFGTKITFTERRGTKKSCLLSRDFAEYDEIKNLIKSMNLSK